MCDKLYKLEDYQNYIIADALRKQNMIIDDKIDIQDYIEVYLNVDEMFEIMSNHWDFLEQVQISADLSKMREKKLIPMFKVKQHKRFFEFIFSDCNDEIKALYISSFGKFASEEDSKEFQVIICKDENIEMLGSEKLYRRIREQLWDSNPTHKMLFTKAWKKRWQKELDEKKMVLL